MRKHKRIVFVSVLVFWQRSCNSQHQMQTPARSDLSNPNFIKFPRNLQPSHILNPCYNTLPQYVPLLLFWSFSQSLYTLGLRRSGTHRVSATLGHFRFPFCNPSVLRSCLTFAHRTKLYRVESSAWIFLDTKPIWPGQIYRVAHPRAKCNRCHHAGMKPLCPKVVRSSMGHKLEMYAIVCLNRGDLYPQHLAFLVHVY